MARKFLSENMKRKKIAEVDAIRATGMALIPACKKAGIGHASYSRWMNKYGSEPTVVTYQASTPEAKTGRPKGFYNSKKPGTQLALLLGTPAQIAEFLKERQ